MGIINMSSSWPRAASALRTLIRAERDLFRNDPQRRQRLIECRDLNRKLINLKPRARRTKTAQPQPDQAQQDPLENGILAVLQTAEVFRTNVIQGLPNERGNYSLNIHKDTELGDNETIMQQKAAAMATGGGGCCSQPSS